MLSGQPLGERCCRMSVCFFPQQQTHHGTSDTRWNTTGTSSAGSPHALLTVHTTRTGGQSEVKDLNQVMCDVISSSEHDLCRGFLMILSAWQEPLMHLFFVLSHCNTFRVTHFSLKSSAANLALSICRRILALSMLATLIWNKIRNVN